jgi:hypothetical protein
MREISYDVRGFLTVRRDSVRVPLRGSLALHADPGSGLFTGDLVLQPATVRRTALGRTVASATVVITPGSPVLGRIGDAGQLDATVTVDAVIAAVRVAGRAAGRAGGGSSRPCRTATHAVVPLRSQPGFRLEQGGRLAARYQRPPFTGCGWLTPLINLMAAGPGNAVVIDLIPVTR